MKRNFRFVFVQKNQKFIETMKIDRFYLDETRLKKIEENYRRMIDLFQRTLSYFSCERTTSTIFLSIIVNLIQSLQVSNDQRKSNVFH